MGLKSPCFSETDVAEADGAPDEKRRETAKSKKTGPRFDVFQRPKEERRMKTNAQSGRPDLST